jgi:hypothetical protein
MTELWPRLLAACAVTAAVSVISPAVAATATGTYSAQPVFVFGIPIDFVLFGLTLLGVAIFHHKTLQVALTGLAVVTVYKLLFTGFRQGEGFGGFVLQMQHEWVILTNLFLLLMGFAILSRHFENSRIPDEMPRFLPDGWTGGLLLLIIVFVLSGFLDMSSRPKCTSAISPPSSQRPTPAVPAAWLATLQPQ